MLKRHWSTTPPIVWHGVVHAPLAKPPSAAGPPGPAGPAAPGGPAGPATPGGPAAPGAPVSPGSPEHAAATAARATLVPNHFVVVVRIRTPVRYV
ncbi:MAG: hypothetical protein EOO74_04665 [Myxococcales bacterium]|nr:MAG: hypothetical protein EOO74_04665 [Myxococcales bacterium]